MARSSEDSRKRLQQAAMELFRERGYVDTTAAEIAARAGVTERTFFRHFSDKKEVLFAGEDELRQTLRDAVAQAPSGLDPLGAVLCGLIAICPLLEAARPHLEARRLVIEASAALQERETAKIAAMVEDLSRAIVGRGADQARAALAAQMGLASLGYAMRLWAGAPESRLQTHLEGALRQMRSLIAGVSLTDAPS